MENMSFSKALALIKGGVRMERIGWNGKGMYVELQRPTADSEMTLPYIFLKTADEHRVPWVVSQTDVLSEDWQEHK